MYLLTTVAAKRPASHFVDLIDRSRHVLVSTPGQPVLEYLYFVGNGFHLQAVPDVVLPLPQKKKASITMNITAKKSNTSARFWGRKLNSIISLVP
ncbi:hypothetical protein AYI94_10040 [Shewanella algae]|nr:hypothetical protein AYI94_10040 [Shewanella algae]